MRNAQNNRRNRGRSSGGRGMMMGQGGGNRNDARVRGNAHQLYEKYKNLSRDAAAAGDRILAEYYLQHADHYFRVLNEMRSERPRDDQRGRTDQFSNEDGGDDGDDTDLNMPAQGFGANAAAGTFGVQAEAPAPVAAVSDDGDAEVGEADEGEAAPETGDRPARSRGNRSRSRGRGRRLADADTAESVDA